MPDPRYLNVEYFFYLVYSFIASVFGVEDSEWLWSRFSFWAQVVWFVFLLIALVFLAGVIYFALKIGEFRRREREKLFGAAPVMLPTEDKVSKMWEDVLLHLESENEANWKLAIIEADKMLDEVLDRLGYEGTSIGEKLKGITPGALEALSDAWEAHKTRNRIAHESNFELTKKEAREAILHYEKVFREVGLI